MPGACSYVVVDDCGCALANATNPTVTAHKMVPTVHFDFPCTARRHREEGRGYNCSKINLTLNGGRAAGPVDWSAAGECLDRWVRSGV